MDGSFVIVGLVLGGVSIAALVEEVQKQHRAMQDRQSERQALAEAERAKRDVERAADVYATIAHADRAAAEARLLDQALAERRAELAALQAEYEATKKRIDQQRQAGANGTRDRSTEKEPQVPAPIIERVSADLPRRPEGRY